MTQNAAELNALIGSRICHDLISPLGAIGNGVELLAMSGMQSAPEMSLIAESVENANARIRYFRVAFGAASEDAQIGRAEVIRVLADLYKGNRLRVDWRLTEDTMRREAKLAFLVLQCFESALPWGGKVAVTKTGSGWSIFGTADRIKIDQPLWDMIADTLAETEISASNVHFALVSPTAQSCGRQVRASINPTSISVSF